MNSDEVTQLRALLLRMGATPAQAEAMSSQLLKRCDQLAAERGWERARAMEHLLTLLVRGRNGESSPGFEGGRPPDEARG